MWLLNPYRFGVPTDPFFPNVSLLLHGDGANGSTTIIDSSPTPKTVTAVGNAQISTAQSRFGGASIAFDGTGDYLTADFQSISDFGASDFTVEAWIYLNQYGGGFIDYGGTIFDTRGASTAQWNNGFLWILTTTGALRLFTSAIVNTTTAVVSLATWTHVAVCRQGSTCRFFIQGNLSSSFSFTNNLLQNSVTIGKPIDLRANTGNLAFNGYIDDLRITKGVARYTANFTPPTAPFPDA